MTAPRENPGAAAPAQKAREGPASSCPFLGAPCKGALGSVGQATFACSPNLPPAVCSVHWLPRTAPRSKSLPTTLCFKPYALAPSPSSIPPSSSCPLVLHAPPAPSHPEPSPQRYTSHPPGPGALSFLALSYSLRPAFSVKPAVLRRQMAGAGHGHADTARQGQESTQLRPQTRQALNAGSAPPPRGAHRQAPCGGPPPPPCSPPSQGPAPGLHPAGLGPPLLTCLPLVQASLGVSEPGLITEDTFWGTQGLSTEEGQDNPGQG